MFEKCVASIEQTIGRTLTKREREDLGARILARKKKFVRQGLGDQEAETRAAKQAADDAEIQRIIEKRNALINATKYFEAIDYVKRVWGDDPVNGIQAMLVGVEKGRFGGRNSIGSHQVAKQSEYLQAFISDLEDADLLHELSSGALDDDIAAALWAIQSDLPVDNSLPSTKIARIMDNHAERARMEANRAGANIARAPGYITNQTHDMFKIRGVGTFSTLSANEAQENWVKFLMGDNPLGRQLLDPETFDDAIDPKRFLETTWEALASGVHLHHGGEGVPSGFKGPSNIAKRMSEHRLLKFADAEAWMLYNRTFGSKSLREAYVSSLMRRANDTALMDGLGTNPRAMLDRIVTHIEQTADADRKRALSKKRALFENQMDVLDGSANIPGNAMAAKWWSAIRATQSLSKLGSAWLSAWSDLGFVQAEMRSLGAAFDNTYLQTLNGFATTKEGRKLAGSLGVFFESKAGLIVERFSADDSVPGSMTKALRLFFKASLLGPWTDNLRTAASLSTSNWVAVNRAVDWDNLDAGLRQTFEQSAITKAEWDLMRGQDAFRLDGDTREFFTPEAARTLTDDQLSASLTGQGINPSETAIANYRREIETKFRQFFSDSAHRAVLTPDARTKAMLLQGTRPGTWKGEFFRLVGQFKAFPTVVLQKTIGRQLFGRGANTMLEALKGGGDLWNLAGTISTATLLGYLAMSAKGIATGRKPRDPADPKTWAQAALQGGALGIYGDFLFGEMKNSYGQTPIDTLLGPTIGNIGQAIDFVGSLKAGEDARAKGFNLIWNNLPGANLFYLRGALDYMVAYRIRESLSPGYIERYESRVRERGQEFFLPPSEAVQ